MAHQAEICKVQRIIDMTHEELANHAREYARTTGDTNLARMANELQAACDNEEPSSEIAAQVIAQLN